MTWIITDSYYRHAQNVFKTFKLQNMGGYHDLYVESDTIKLTDVFQMYRKTLHYAYKEDPAKYLTLSLHTYDACLKYTKIKLQVLKDIDTANIIHYGKREVIPHGITK